MRRMTVAQILQIVAMDQELLQHLLRSGSTPKDAPQWSVRSMAKAQGVSSALVLCVDEKSQIQALDRTQPVLPLRPGIPARQTHDYERHGTTTLFAALNILDGSVIGSCLPRHRHSEFIKFLERIEVSTPRRREIHVILDNYGTHKHPLVKQWFSQHPRYHLHFTPTSASWLNLVERWFAEITRKRIRRGTFTSLPALISAIREYMRSCNRNSKPFNWTATSSTILRKVKHC